MATVRKNSPLLTQPCANTSRAVTCKGKVLSAPSLSKNGFSVPQQGCFLLAPNEHTQFGQTADRLVLLPFQKSRSGEGGRKGSVPPPCLGWFLLCSRKIRAVTVQTMHTTNLIPNQGCVQRAASLKIYCKRSDSSTSSEFCSTCKGSCKGSGSVSADTICGF